MIKTPDILFWYSGICSSDLCVVVQKTVTSSSLHNSQNGLTFICKCSPRNFCWIFFCVCVCVSTFTLCRFYKHFSEALKLKSNKCSVTCSSAVTTVPQVLCSLSTFSAGCGLKHFTYFIWSTFLLFVFIWPIFENKPTKMGKNLLK